MRKIAMLLAALTGFLLVIRGPAEAGNTVPAVSNVVFRLYKGAVVGAVTNVEEGAFGYDFAEHMMRYYDGTAWRRLLQEDGSAMDLSGIEMASVTAGVNWVSVELGTPLTAAFTEVPGSTGGSWNVEIGWDSSQMTGEVTEAIENLQYTRPGSDLEGYYIEPSVVRLRGLDLPAVTGPPGFVYPDNDSLLTYTRVGGARFAFVAPTDMFALYETDPVWSATSNQVTTSINSVSNRVTVLESAPAPTATIAWSNLYPMAGMSMGLDILYVDTNTVQFNAGSIFGPTGSVYRRTNVLNFDVTPPADSGFVYLFVDDDTSTPGAADGLQVVQSSAAPVRNSATRQWVSYDDTGDRYIGCVLWIKASTGVTAGIAKFVYTSGGTYALCDTRLFPAAATDISGWHAKVRLGVDQDMTGGWVSPTVTASSLLPGTACEALVVGLYGNAVYEQESAGHRGFMVSASEAENLYGAVVFVNGAHDIGFAPYTWTGGASFQSSTMQQIQVGQAGWVPLGASRNLRAAGDDMDSKGTLSWAITGWKEQR